ncbi:Ankyrin-1 [Talaromyces islandicus]|uniref:Ankyrin-1 n=1 Tax=Talaromyces islandicus TaxID=28573 RepID=A0A0U1LKY0_TALIS|nr:Ankyrin-1 [Talaromyces islandicus]
MFVGHDFGGLIIKQALYLALTTHQYRHIAAMTSLLVFFATPHRVQSSKSIASWMLFVAGQDRAYKVSWFSETAHMVETVNAAFSRFQLIYKIISIYGILREALEGGLRKRQGLSESSATMGIPTERKIYRDEVHDRIAVFNSGEDPIFQAICQELNRSKNPGFPYVDCLDYLTGFLRAEEIETRRPGVFGDSCAHRHELYQLKQHTAYQDWVAAQSGSLFVQGNIGIDNVIELMEGEYYTIGGNLKISSHTMFDSAQLPAFLCHQLLCLEPGLFRHVQRLTEHLYAEPAAWPDKIWILLRSLLSCPSHPARVCCIKESVGGTASNAHSALRRLFRLGEDPALPFKLLTITPSAQQTMTQLDASARWLVELGPRLENFQPTLRYALDTLTNVRPEHAKLRGHIEFALNARYDEISQTLKGQWEAPILDVVHSWTAIIASESSPATRRSVRLSASELEGNLHDLYMRVLEMSEARRDGPMVLRTLFWCTRAFRPLHVQELRVAAALDLGSMVIADLIDQIPLNFSWDVNASFCPLAYIADDQVMVLQDSFASFLVEPHYGPCKKGCLFCENTHATMALKCLHYIGLVDDAQYFQSQLQLDDDETDKPWCLLEYAVTYWPEHYKLAKKTAAGDRNDVEILPGFDKYFNDKLLIRKWAHLYCAIPHPLKAAVWVDPMLVTVETGCLDLVKTMLKSPDATKPEVLTTAIEIAISNGNVELIQLFAESGASSVNALHLAALSGRLTMRPLLLQAWDACGQGEEDLNSLHFACKSGHVEMVSELLQHGVDINAKTRETGSTPLHVACQYGHCQTILHLLERGADINATDKNGRTPLHVATLWQQSLAVCALLEHSLTEGIAIDLVAVDIHKATALHLAASEGRLDILEHIIKHLEDKDKDTDSDEITVQGLLSIKDSHGATPLHHAAAQGHANIVHMLISLESRYSCSHILALDGYRDYPIHPAVRSGHLEVVELLLGEEGFAGDQLKHGGKDGACAIHLAILHGHIDLVQRLCEIHKDVNVSFSLFYGAGSQSPLHLAVENCQVDMVEHLLNAEATPNIMDATEATPLHYASRKGFLPIVDLLLKHKARVDIPDQQGVSPLLAAAESDHEKVAKRLIDSYADVDAMDKDRNTALMAACKCNNPQVTRWLLEAGAKVGAVDRQGRCALHRAAEYASADALQILLKHDPPIDPNCKDGDQNNGNTPLLLAVQAESMDPIPAIRILLENRAKPDLDNSEGITPFDLAKTAEVVMMLADAVDFTQSDSSRALQQRLLWLSAEKGYLDVIKHQHSQFSADLSVKNVQDQSLYHLSAQNGHLDVVEYLIAKLVAGYDQEDIRKRTPAWYAAKYGHLAILTALANAAPGSLNQADEEWTTPLSNAVEEQHFDIVKYLLKNKEKFSIHWEQDHGEKKANCTLYHLATNQPDGSVDMIELLLDHNVPGLEWKDDHERVPVIYAAIHGSLETVEVLRRAAFGSFNQVDEDGKTPLYYAVERRHKEVIKYFVNENVDLDVTELQSGWTALHLAVFSDQDDVVNILVSKGAACDVQDNRKRTPLFLAAYHGRETMVTLLLSKKPNVHVVDEKGWTPLIAAYDHDGILEQLIAAGASIHAKANDGLTALLGAASYHTDSVELLLSHGANVLDVDDEGWTPLHFATNSTEPDHINLLLEEIMKRGHSPDTANNKGHTPLMTAVYQGHPTVAQTLLKSGQFDINHVDLDGQSLAMLAMKRDPEFVELLLDHGGSDLSLQQLEQVLAWVTEKNYRHLQIKCIDLALGRPRPLHVSSADKLFQIAVGVDDRALVRFLCRCELIPEQRDQHNWTLRQIDASFRLPESQPALDETQLRPSTWDSEYMARGLVLSEDQLTLYRDHPSEEEMTAVRANNPVRMGEKFYFEVEIVTCVTNCVGVGFCRKNCNLYRMPGWESDTWGVHADDGGLFHGSGWPKIRGEYWAYTSGDVIGCCIDFARRKAAFTKNGSVVSGACFAAITGRVFPMVTLGVGDRVVANFGDAKGMPFRYPSGRDWAYTDEVEI